VSPGPRVKPTIETAGDIAYGGRRRAAVTQALRELQRRIDDYNAAVDRELRRLHDERARATALPRVDEQLERDVVSAAREWIFEHGGTVTAALKLTHPDHGGTATDFQKTMWARDILRGRKKTQRPR